MSDLSMKEIAVLLPEGKAFPEGRGWKCPNGHEYPEDFEPTRCPIDNGVLIRSILQFNPRGA